MGRRDPLVDAYIAKAEPFARPILRHVRVLVHKACPEAEETLKWRMPTFMHHGILCSMAAFKGHASFGFWKGRQVVPDADRHGDSMGSFGRLTEVADLPSARTLTGYIRKAARLNEEGAKSPRRPARKPRPAPRPPADLRRALDGAGKARATWGELSPSHRREYVEWITEAKQASTRARRVSTTVEWLAEGKSRNWKYER
ncbi:MAG TPA: YdeI/OmpD-associated family protein [Gemmatimonadales bacterium]|nr:YdeI/OmpD-associated family protein [Gemmatimonadales bacterium]